MAEALIDFAVQAHLSISVSAIDFHGAVSNPVDGNFSQAEALTRIMAGSSFGFAFVDRDTVEIKPVAAARNALAPAVETVIVTGTKREDLAQNLSYSIVAVSGHALTAFAIQSPHDLPSQVAGLTTTNLGPGEDKLFVRGLTDSVLPGLSESVVGVYLDEARIVDDAPDPDLRLIDIDHVEVLRGPQGTLYGAGALTGLVRIVTQKPVYDVYQASINSSVSATEDGGLAKSLEGVLNVPMIDRELAARIVAYIDDKAGYVDNVRLDTSDTNRATIEGGRVSIGWTPAARWTILGNVALQNTRVGDSQYYLQTLGAYKRDNFLPEPHEDHFLAAGITASGDLGWADLVSSTNFVSRSYWTQFDASFAWPTLTGFSVGPSPFDFSRNIRSLSHETRLASEGESRWQWLVGLSLDHRDEDFQSALSGPDANRAEIVARQETREDRLNEAALFGEITYGLAEDVSVTAGARGYVASHIVSAASSGLLVRESTSFSGANRQSGVTPKLLVKYEPRPDETFYAQFSEGYRLGGINVDGPSGVTGENEATFDSDNLRNYEIGAKLKFFGGRAFANAAVYYEDWSNVQTDEIAPDGAFFIVNAGRVSDPGFELDFDVTPMENFLLKGNFFWNDASLARSNVSTTAESGLPGSPSASAGLSAEYVLQLAPDVAGFVNLSDAYVGTSHLGFSEVTPAMGNYNLSSLRLGILRGAWQATVFVENLTADHGNTFAFGNPFNPLPQITPPRPRTVGLSLSWTD